MATEIGTNRRCSSFCYFLAGKTPDQVTSRATRDISRPPSRSDLSDFERLRPSPLGHFELGKQSVRVSGRRAILSLALHLNCAVVPVRGGGRKEGERHISKEKGVGRASKN